MGEWSLGCSRRLAPGPLTGGRPDGPSAAGRPRTALGPAGAGQLPTVPRGAVRAGGPPASGQRLPPRPGGKPSRALPGSVSTAKSLSQKLVLSGCSLRSEMSLRRTPRSLGVRVRGAGVSGTAGSAAACVGPGTPRGRFWGRGRLPPRPGHPAAACPVPGGCLALDTVCAAPDPTGRAWRPVDGLRRACRRQKLAGLAPLPAGRGPCPCPALRRMPGAKGRAGPRRCVGWMNEGWRPDFSQLSDGPEPGTALCSKSLGPGPCPRGPVPTRATERFEPRHGQDCVGRL